MLTAGACSLVSDLKARLEDAKSSEERQKEAHRQNVQKMLQANEALQQQLKELNGVVERVVQTSLGSPPRPQKLPIGAFPAVAKPGSKAQRSGPPRSVGAGPQQAAVGSKPFK